MMNGAATARSSARDAPIADFLVNNPTLFGASRLQGLYSRFHGAYQSDHEKRREARPFVTSQ